MLTYRIVHMHAVVFHDIPLNVTKHKLRSTMKTSTAHSHNSHSTNFTAAVAEGGTSRREEVVEEYNYLRAAAEEEPHQAEAAAEETHYP
jgi:hypothetical protein